jgi:phospholipid transport system substrate-binding protein
MRLKSIMFLITSIIFISLALTYNVKAGEPTERIRATTDRLLTIITDPDLKAPEVADKRNRMIRETVDKVFDWEAFSRRALATHWSKRSRKEKNEFISLFGQLLERTYIDKTRQYSGEKVIFLDEHVDGKYGEVKTNVITRNGKEIKVDYRVMKEKDGWFVYDVYVEGISFVNNYRVQFNNIITRSSYEDLIDRLKSKLMDKSQE